MMLVNVNFETTPSPKKAFLFQVNFIQVFIQRNMRVAGHIPAIILCIGTKQGFVLMLPFLRKLYFQQTFKNPQEVLFFTDASGAVSVLSTQKTDRFIFHLN